MDDIVGVMVSSNPKSSQIKYDEIGICSFSANPAALRSKIKDWLAGSRDNVSDWSDMSTPTLLCK